VAESGLSVGFGDLLSEVGWYLGYGRGVATAWTASQLSEITGIVQSGVRRVYYPPAISADINGYEWSWLRPNEYLDILGNFTSGTISVANGVVVLDVASVAQGIMFPSNAGDAWFGAAGIPTVPVSSMDSATQLTLTDLTINIPSGTAYSLGFPNYDLPDNFGRLIGTMHYPEVAYRHTISVVSTARLLDMRAYANLADDPIYCAIRYTVGDGGVTGSRQEILFFPTPNKPWTLSYEYEAYQGALSNDFPYPLGGMQMAEVYIESCLALAETRINDEIGQHAQQFQALLVDAIARDRKRGAQRYGEMGHREEDWRMPFRRGWVGPPYPITYHGELI
jgi:hypothetical protein